jgi:hypothetical protein
VVSESHFQASSALPESGRRVIVERLVGNWVELIRIVQISISDRLILSICPLRPGIVLRVVNIVGFAFLLTWTYNGTESVLLVLLLHAGINTANSTLVPLPIEAITGESFMTVLIAVDLAVWVVAIVPIVATRGQLGYDTTRDTADRQEIR